jgi:glycolate oxidase FAD binding subunit
MRLGFHAPETAEELAFLVAEAADTHSPVEVMGRGTKREVGRPAQSGAVLSTEAMVGIPLYEPSELVLVALAGTPLAEIENLLAENGQELPFEPVDLGPALGFGSGQATIGGTLAANLSGSRRILVGSARDHVLGVKAVNGRGELIKAGGRVKKNVTGYDLSRALAGSWGTLAIMTEIALKVLPTQRESRTVLCFGLRGDQRGRGGGHRH